MDESSLSVHAGSIDELEAALERAIEIRDEHDDVYPPSIDYCLVCDEVNLVTRKQDDDGYHRLDCRDKHNEYILHNSQSHAAISAWLQCIKFLKEHGLTN